jgi:hypothetical protein
VYDRIISTGFKVGAMKSAAVFLFDKVYKLSPQLTAKVSDHYPVETTLLEQGLIFFFFLSFFFFFFFFFIDSGVLSSFVPRVAAAQVLAGQSSRLKGGRQPKIIRNDDQRAEVINRWQARANARDDQVAARRRKQ